MSDYAKDGDTPQKLQTKLNNLLFALSNVVGSPITALDIEGQIGDILYRAAAINAKIIIK